jgi:hypothetical protein
MGFEILFCSRSCVAVYNNSLRGNQIRPIVKTCGFCGGRFNTTTGKAEATFCSRSCASSGSVTEARRIAAKAAGRQNNFTRFSESDRNGMLEVIAKGLKKREQWKYKKLSAFLDWIGESYEIEAVLCGSIRDLILPVRKIAVEFDGPHHQEVECAKQDAIKDEQAAKEGWTVIRIKTATRAEIDPATVYDIFRKPEAK